MSDDTELKLIELTADITIAWLSNERNRVGTDELPMVVQTIHSALSLIGGDSSASEDATPDYVPAVSVRRSLASKDHIISMIDGKPYKMLKRHLTTQGITPDEYRRRYNLKPDYPMIAENYAAMRSALAKKIGLGQKGRAAKRAPTKPARASRPSKV